ncbi:pyruvate carboxylase [Tessaracoccus flavus]|uniref:Pyruvate carboxylase n=1 Tax=Tessaracoccus flavus TaxID=1610493 RepID=A0A1Q2CGN8_9ACTN|nr:pyruvate carboxylase [Tessaracoccus flavus]AQP45281.1 pyruvate carboxylase [Tessaracoccus flavus]SDY50302.1 pyruvate carboxylase [Tessaracoccus flavus]
MISKVLVANRGEIAVRGFRAAYELGFRTVAVFAHEDRNADHRIKAHESYLIGEEGHPVRAYLDIDEIIRAAKESGSDAIYPGYGFLSENPDLAAACAANGITFIGPPAHVIELAGNKVRALEEARKAGVPTLDSTPPSTDVDELTRGAEEIGFPVFIKAVAGGGGRGMRRVDDPAKMAEELGAAMREAQGAFGDPTVFIEQAVAAPRHIEVQILADGEGNIVHLFERDCSIQRRHQKVIEIAPAPHISDELREALCSDAVKFAEAIDYFCAGTVEFLVETEGERAGQHVFIEMNPRIQVEHTVTEEITDVDLVQAQMRIANGETLEEIGIRQDELEIRGAALQCRITTEDPTNSFRPDTGLITAYRSASGAGIRLDGGTTGTGVEISPHFDSLLVKLTARGRDLHMATARARRALAEFRVRGVATNIPFLRAVLDDPDFEAGGVTTSFIDERPYLLTARTPADRATKLLRYIAEVTVNKPHGDAPMHLEPRVKLPQVDLTSEIAAGARQRLLALGAEGFAKELRDAVPVGVTDTTYRDAHQSLLATRVRTRDLLEVAPVQARLLPQMLSVECWGGATYDVALRFLGEDPWERLAALREAMPNQNLQMLLRGRNTVGYTPYPTEVTNAFVAEAASTGVDIFRIFDALNDVEQMRPAIEAVRETPSVAEVALCYTSNLLDPAEKIYTLDYYLKLAEKIVDSGAHILAIKDMAGLLRPEAARRLVTALRERFDLPVHLHTHDTTGGQLATLLAAIEAGVDAVDVANSALSSTTSQPPMSALLMALDQTERAPGLDPEAVLNLEPYWEAVRKIYRPFESGLPAPTGRVYSHEIPGGQLSNLRQQAIALGLGDKFEQIEDMYEAADKILGRPTKVTPSSKVVGDLALHLVAVGADPAEFEADPQRFDIPDSVIGFLNGELGEPAGGWPEPFRSKAIEGRRQPVRVTEVPDEDLALLAEQGRERQQTLNRLLFPGPTKEFEQRRGDFGDISVLPTLPYLYGMDGGEQEYAITLEKGVTLLVGLEAIGEPDKRGKRTVMCTLNGQIRPVRVRDLSIKSEVAAAEKADSSNKGHVAAPFSGAVTPTVEEGATVSVGDAVATIEAMKMEAAINAPVAGKVSRVVLSGTTQLEGGDLVVVIDPA